MAVCVGIGSYNTLKSKDGKAYRPANGTRTNDFKNNRQCVEFTN